MSTDSLSVALDQYFAPYAETQTLVAELVQARKHPADILILLCARLDALASESVTEGTSSKQAFVRFIDKFGRKKDLFQAVSVGDVYYELLYYRWVLPGTMPEPGRLTRFSRLDDPILHLLEDAGLPLTLPDSQRLLDTLARVIAAAFKVKPNQSRTKPRLAAIATLETALATGMARTRLKAITPDLRKAIKPLLDKKRVGTILYEKYRCDAIHGSKVVANPKAFFTKRGLYWNALRSEHYGPFECIEFSAPFLIGLLNACIKNYRAYLQGRRLLPPDVHFHAFGDAQFEHLDVLDHKLLLEQGRVKLKLDTR